MHFEKYRMTESAGKWESNSQEMDQSNVLLANQEWTMISANVDLEEFLKKWNSHVPGRLFPVVATPKGANLGLPFGRFGPIVAPKPTPACRRCTLVLVAGLV